MTHLYCGLVRKPNLVSQQAGLQEFLQITSLGKGNRGCGFKSWKGVLTCKEAPLISILTPQRSSYFALHSTGNCRDWSPNGIPSIRQFKALSLIIHTDTIKHKYFPAASSLSTIFLSADRWHKWISPFVNGKSSWESIQEGDKLMGSRNQEMSYKTGEFPYNPTVMIPGPVWDWHLPLAPHFNKHSCASSCTPSTREFEIFCIPWINLQYIITSTNIRYKDIKLTNINYIRSIINHVSINLTFQIDCILIRSVSSSESVERIPSNCISAYPMHLFQTIFTGSALILIEQALSLLEDVDGYVSKHLRENGFFGVAVAQEESVLVYY